MRMGHASGMDTQAMVRDMRSRSFICLFFTVCVEWAEQELA